MTVMLKEIAKKIFGRERLRKWHFSLSLLLKPKYRKSFIESRKYFCEIDEVKKEELKKSLLDHYFVKDGYLDTDIGKNDLKDHMENRLHSFRYEVLPWINSIISLKKSSVLEIGCGTGSASVALAEQGCELTGIDVNDIHIKVAQKRCELYGLTANISSMNATDISQINKKFDLIVFSASLEHMTYDERIISLKSAWGLLNKNGFLVVIETPNRLYYFDGHSSLLPFYHWLPDQIAIQYSKFSPREACMNSGSDEMRFIRFGRGVSFHEFELALNIKCCDFEVYPMQPFTRTFISNIVLGEAKYNKFMRKLGPKNISEGFYYSSLYIAIKKFTD
jgi:S-adenosylmethionine-dependent methyltransferase